MNRRIYNRENEINSEQGTTEGLSEEITHTVATVKSKITGREEVKHFYTIYGEVISSNVEISEFELGQIKKTLKENI